MATVVGAGVTLHEALTAYETLKKEDKINIRVVDAFCLKVSHKTISISSCFCWLYISPLIKS